MRAEFRVLGPLEVTVDGTPVILRSRLQRTLLAALLLRAPRAITVGELCATLWDDALPIDARGALQVHVSRLRRALAGAGTIETAPAGYRIDVPPAALDLLRFERATREAIALRERGELRAEADALAEARELWRDGALADVPSSALHREVVPALTEQWLQVCERFFELSIQLGRADQMLPELRAATLAHPYREGLWYHWIRALHRCDRQAEALAAYAEVRRLLNEELGIDPGDRLRRLQQAILCRSGEAALPVAGPGARPEPARDLRSRQLVELPYLRRAEQRRQAARVAG